MKAIEFPEQNVVYAKDQPEYQPLPAFRNETESISLWEPTPEEREAIANGANIWVRQMNFSQPLQPIHISTDDPFVRPPKRVIPEVPKEDREKLNLGSDEQG